MFTRSALRHSLLGEFVGGPIAGNKISNSFPSFQVRLRQLGHCNLCVGADPNSRWPDKVIHDTEAFVIVKNLIALTSL